MSTPGATLADRLAALCELYDATYERTAPEGGPVTILFRLSAGDVFSGQGATTADAVTALEAKLEKIGHAL